MNSNVWARTRREALIRLWGEKCERCGSSEALEFAHAEPTSLHGRGRGRKERLADISLHKDSYMLLCHGCHEEYDRSPSLS